MTTDHFVPDRRSPRHKVMVPIALVANLGGKRALVPASALDFSPEGLRVQTSFRLTIGELINVQFEEGSSGSGLRQYKVVWTRPAGGLLPGQAGLESVKSACEALLKPVATPNAEPLRSVA